MANTQIDLHHVRWRKSTYSNGDGGSCVEVGDSCLKPVGWTKSTYSNGSGGGCLEVAPSHNGLVPVRDSKTAPHGATLTFGAQPWARFVGAVRTGALAG